MSYLKKYGGTIGSTQVAFFGKEEEVSLSQNIEEGT